VIAAGNDLALHCSGDMAEMIAVASAVGEIAEAGRERLARAMARVSTIADGSDYAEAAAKRDELLALA
jgi:beta-N-acetylhexosaminidase